MDYFALEYHKIESVFKRGEDFKFIEGAWRLDEFAYLKNNKWVATEKIDGMNIRIMWNATQKIVVAAGRTDKAMLPGMLSMQLQKLFPPEKFEKYETDIILYGEGYGKGIQDIGALYSDKQDFILFDKAYRRGNKYIFVDDDEITRTADEFGIKRVSIVACATLPEIINLVKDGLYSFFGDFYAEGVVAKPLYEMSDRYGNRIITKIKHKDFRR